MGQDSDKASKTTNGKLDKTNNVNQAQPPARPPSAPSPVTKPAPTTTSAVTKKEAERKELSTH
jgi:hypothetical protein